LRAQLGKRGAHGLGHVERYEETHVDPGLIPVPRWAGQALRGARK
jgi:hypothetical protein